MLPIRPALKTPLITSSKINDDTEPAQAPGLFSVQQNQAAIKIQRTVRRNAFRNERVEGINSRTRRQIISLMERLSSKVKNSSTARFVNTRLIDELA